MSEPFVVRESVRARSYLRRHPERGRPSDLDAIEKLEAAETRFEAAKREFFIADDGNRVEFPIRDPKVGRDYTEFARAGNKLDLRKASVNRRLYTLGGY